MSDRYSIGEALPRLALNRRVTVFVLVAATLVLGIVALVQMPIELIPRGYQSPFLRVVVPWREAPVEEVLDKLTIPLEEEISTVRGIDGVFSFSRSGFTSIFINFKYGTDMAVAYRELRDRIERARLLMPDDVEQVLIRKDDDAGFPVAVIGITVPEGVTDVYDVVENEVILSLERIDGVATVDVQGLEEKEVLIELDRERVEASGLNIYRIAQDLARDNFSLASGHVKSGSKKLLLRSVARYRDPGVVGDVQVAPGVRLNDIATLRYDEPEKNYRVRVNSRAAFALMVLKEGEANTLEVARSVTRKIEELRLEPRLRDVEIELIMNQGDMIKDSLSVLLSSGRLGAVLAMLVLFFFLRRLRTSLLIALSIPLSMVIALVVMFFAGETLNILTLLGLMISVGLLVDNSVVVAENIHRVYRQGTVDRRRAAIRGTGEIGLAITTATLTTAVVFLPVALVGGEGDFYLRRFAIPIAVSLLASLLVALVVVPLGVSLCLPRRGEEAAAVGFWAGWRRRLDTTCGFVYDQTFGRLGRSYVSLVRYFLGQRLDLLLVILLVVAATAWLAIGRLGVVPVSEEDQRFFQIEVRLPESNTFEESEAWFRRAEEAVAGLSEGFGLDFYILVQRKIGGQIQGAIGSDSEQSPRQIVEQILAALPEAPGLELHTGMASDNEKEQLALATFTLFGDNPELLETTASEIEARFLAVDGVLAVKSAGDESPSELALLVDRERARQQGVDPRTLAGVVSYALRGQNLPRIYVGGRDVPVRIRFEEEDRTGVAQLGSFAVPVGDGDATVDLGSLVEARPLPSAKRIFRRDKQMSRRIVLELADGREQETRKTLQRIVRQIDLPEGIRFGGPGRDTAGEEVASLLFAAALSVIFVYLLMGLLFESFLRPLSILATIPLAFLGVAWIHLLVGRDIDFLGVVGVILLIGVVVNNGIVLLDSAQQLRAEGVERQDAVVEAVSRRFRPIMMTALTTICGMLPLTVGAPNSMGLSYKSFGLTLIGGMVASSFLTLLVVPVLYTVVEDGRTWFARCAAAALAASSEGEDSPGVGRPRS